MEELRQGVFSALRRSINAFVNAEVSGVETADARVAVSECIKILREIGVPKQVGSPVEGVEVFVVNAFRAAGKAAQDEILDILKNRAYDEKF